MTVSSPHQDVHQDTRARAVRAAVEVLADRGIDLTAAAEAWSARAADAGPDRSTIDDLKTRAETAPLPFLDDGDVMSDDNPTAGIVLEGFDPPFFFRRIERATTRSPGPSTGRV